MSAESTYAEAPLAGTGEWYARTRPWPILGVAAAVGAASGAVVAGSDVLLRPGWFAVFSAYNVIAFTGAALLWLRRRPGSPVGPQLMGLAAVVAGVSMQGWATPVPFSIGVLFDPVLLVLFWFLVLTYPSRKFTRPAAATLALLAGAVVAGFVPWFFLSPHVAGATPLARCTAACPENAFELASRPDIAGHFGNVEEAFRVAFACAFLALLVARLLRASRPQRRVLAPVYVVAAVWSVAFGAFGVGRFLLVTDARVWDALGWVLTGARVTLPAAFVLALVLAQMFAGRALSAMMQRLGRRPGPAELERAAREELGDPTFTVAVAAAGSGESLDDPVAVGPGRRRRELRSDGALLAVLEYDDALDDDPELLDAASRAIQLSLQSERLDSDLRDALVELRESQRRLASAGAAERLRIERELHDSAQQSIVALRMQLARANERLGGDPELERLGEGLGAALAEIRAIAHGVYPATLRDFGLEGALAQAARTDPRVRLQASNLGRYADDVELAFYFAALEAIQNAAKHGRADTSIVVSLREESAELRFEVRDNGPGFDPETAPIGGGLTGLSDRIQAVGGRVETISSPGGSTCVRGAVDVRGRSRRR